MIIYLKNNVMEVETEYSHAKLDKEEDFFHQNNKRIMEKVDISSYTGKEQVHIFF